MTPYERIVGLEKEVVSLKKKNKELSSILDSLIAFLKSSEKQLNTILKSYRK
jgi:hypothetical protein